MARDINRDAIAWLRPQREKKRLPIILSPKSGKSRTCLLLGGELFGVFVHFFAGRTIPCTAPLAECEGCKSGLARRDRKHYCAAVTPRGFYPCLPEITPHALETLPELACPEKLRGRLLTLERPGEKYNSPVWAKLSSPREFSEGLEEAFDVPGALVAIWESEGET